MNIDAVELAKYIIDKCTKEERPISNLQLQKMLYFLFMDVYKKYKQFLFKNRIEAWAYGPVIPDVYKIYSDNGRFKIFKEYDDIKLPIEPQIMNFIDEKIVYMRSIPAWNLVEKSHKEGTPWEKVYKQGCKIEISKNDIKASVGND